MQIPLIQIKTSNDKVRLKIENAVKKVIKSGSFIGFPWVDGFEKSFRDYLDVSYSVAVSSGTAALHLALLSCDIGPGDEVITTPYTFIATIEAICYTGAKPVFVDIDSNSFNINANLIESKISSRTKAIISVHLYGQPSDMNPILKLARKYKLKVIEDACQAHGAQYKLVDSKKKKETWKKVGTLGDIGCFSFYPTKNLAAYGDAGIIVTNNKNLAQKIKSLRDHGQEEKYKHRLIGYNYRMSSIQAAILDVKLKYLDERNNKRRENAGYYNRMIENSKIILPEEMDYAYHVYHLYTIRAKKRDNLIKHLHNNNIGAGLYYTIPSHLQPAYKVLDYKRGDFPETENCARESVAIPIFPGLTQSEIRFISKTINNWH